MASIHQDRTTGIYRISFHHGGRQFQKSLKTTKEKEADQKRADIERTLALISEGRLSPPDNAADWWRFVFSGGRVREAPSMEKGVTLAGLFAWYFDRLPQGAREPKTLKTEHIHEKHMLRILGKTTDAAGLTVDDLQRYVTERRKEKWHGRPIRPCTIKKEVDTFKKVWRLAATQGMLVGGPPTAGLAFPRDEEKPSFLTWQEVEAKLANGRHTEEEKRALWNRLFLDKPEVEEVLTFAREEHGRRGRRGRYFYPLLVFVAHTGARLSEAMRSRKEDIDFNGRWIFLWEKKKKREMMTTRRVRMSALLAATLEDYWKHDHPGGSYTFSIKPDAPLQESTLHEAFEWFFRDSKWAVLRGFHVFRHSFASIMAKNRTDARVIDEILGHQTEEMRKRYRHLFPEQLQAAMPFA